MSEPIDLTRWTSRTWKKRPDDYPYPEAERPRDAAKTDDDGNWQPFVPAPTAVELAAQAKQDALDTATVGIAVRVETLREAGLTTKQVNDHLLREGIVG